MKALLPWLNIFNLPFFVIFVLSFYLRFLLCGKKIFLPKSKKKSKHKKNFQDKKILKTKNNEKRNENSFWVIFEEPKTI